MSSPGKPRPPKQVADPRSDAELRAEGARIVERFLGESSGYAQWWLTKHLSRIERELERRSGGRRVRPPTRCRSCGSHDLVGDEFGTPRDVLVVAARPGLCFVPRDKWNIGTMFVCRGCGATAPGLRILPHPDGGVTVWRLRAGGNPGLQAVWLDEGIVSISEDRVGVMGDGPGRFEIKRRLRRAQPQASERTISAWAGYWIAFLGMKAGDLVLVPLANREVAIGEVLGDYEYEHDHPNRRLRHRREVQWLLSALPRTALPADLLHTVIAPGTIRRVRTAGAESHLRALAGC